MKNLEAKFYYWFSRAFNLPALKKSRLHWVDYLKGIAIILVVYRHSLLGIQRSGLTISSYLVNANMIFYSFRMPLFFLLSGIFISRSLATRSVKQFVSAKFESLMYPYFIWAFIQVTLQICLSHFTNSARSLIDYTYILYQPRNLDQFWYLPALFNATMIFLLIKKYGTSTWWLQLLIGLGFYFLSPYLQRVSMISDWMEFYIFFALGDVISQLFFKHSTQNFLKNGYALLAVIPVFVVTQIFYLEHVAGKEVTSVLFQTQFLAIALIGCFSMLLLAFRLQTWNAFSFLRVLGFHSLQIYVMHVMIAALIRIFLISVFGIQDPVILLLFCISGGCIIPVIIYNLFIYKKAGWFLFTYKKAKSKPVPVNTTLASLATA